MRKVTVIDSHTGGEPTRVVVAGGPELGRGPLAARREKFQREFDHFRSAIVNEPRGSDVMVGALLVEPEDKTCATGVIFFNNVGCLGMCGHGTIGLVVTLAHLGKIKPGEHKIETPVGIVTATLHANGEVSVANVPSWRAKKNFTVDVPGVGEVTGDVAWGGNWFFLVEKHGQELSLANVEQLTDFCWRVRQAVNAQGFPEVDHVELFGPPTIAGAQFAKFRSMSRQGLRPLALRHRHQREARVSRGGRQTGRGRDVDSGKHHRQQVHREIPVAGPRRGKILPVITGTAFVNAEATQLLDENDPFCWGIR